MHEGKKRKQNNSVKSILKKKNALPPYCGFDFGQYMPQWHPADVEEKNHRCETIIIMKKIKIFTFLCVHYDLAHWKN